MFNPGYTDYPINCPAGKIAIAGGYEEEYLDATDRLDIITNAPLYNSPPTWHFKIHNRYTLPVKVNFVVLCMFAS